MVYKTVLAGFNLFYIFIIYVCVVVVAAFNGQFTSNTLSTLLYKYIDWLPHYFEQYLKLISLAE